MKNHLETESWKDKISNPAQIGGIETAVLDNGYARGVRIARVNTGTGLCYKIVLDRAMDIADAFYNQYSLAWISRLGISNYERFSNKGTDWLNTFGGGLMVTCGLSSIGGPEGGLGLHGQVSNLPAEIESFIQPDPVAGKMQMSITGIIRETKIFGPNIRLKRTISGELGKAVITIQDEVMNCGNESTPHMLLYHCNFGWPLIDDGTEILWKGKWLARDEASKQIFNEKNDFHTCPKPLVDHNGIGEAAAFIDMDADENGICTCGLYNKKIGLQLNLKYNKTQLPWLTNWQHWGKGEYVTGLEPGTHPPIGQAKAKESETLIYLEPGESRKYDLEFELLTKN